MLATSKVFGLALNTWDLAKVIDREADKAGKTHKGGDMDQEDLQHESGRGELPVEPRMGQAFTY